jgi:hypothetical protein
MENQVQNKVYVNMMVDTLIRKKRILTFLLEKTRKQEQLLKATGDMDADAFQALIEEKGTKIDELNTIDEGFDTLFKYVEKEIVANRAMYQEQIEQMQKLITEVSELGIQIQALEHQNSGHFKVYLANQKKTIREFHLNQRTVSTYFQNMSGTHKPEQSYFFNETK